MTGSIDEVKNCDLLVDADDERLRELSPKFMAHVELEARVKKIDCRRLLLSEVMWRNPYTLIGFFALGNLPLDFLTSEK